MLARHGEGLLHAASTQQCEGFNGMAARMTPTSLCVALTEADPSRQAATVARFNDGMEAATSSWLVEVGAQPGALLQHGLRLMDKTRARHAKRKASPQAKGKRTRARQTRVERTQGDDAGSDGEGEYAAGMAF